MVVVRFPSAEERASDAIAEAFMAANEGNEMVRYIGAMNAIINIVEHGDEVDDLDDISLSPVKALINTHLLRPCYPDERGILVKRDSMTFHQWRNLVEELKAKGELDHAEAIQRWGMAHFSGICSEMLYKFIAEHAHEYGMTSRRA
jgi:hypothetical protein